MNEEQKRAEAKRLADVAEAKGLGEVGETRRLAEVAEEQSLADNTTGAKGEKIAEKDGEVNER